MQKTTERIPNHPAKPKGQRPEDERLGIIGNFTYGLQHVLTMYGGIIAVPLIVGQAAGVSPGDIGLLIAACLFMAGLATLLQTLGLPYFGAQLPLVQGVSFASVATILAIVGTSGGGVESLDVIFGAVMASALIGLVITPFFSKIIHFFPPVVTGTVITTIGLTLMPVTANWAMGGNAKAPNYGSMANIGLAAVTLLIVLILSKVKSAAISRLSILLAIVIGTIIAVIAGMTDFSKVGNGAIVGFPVPFHFGLPKFEIAAIISMFIVVLVIMVETSADVLAIGEIVDTPVDSRRLGDGLRADMISSAVSPIFGSFTQSAFAQNVGLVAVTKVKSRFVVAAGGGILVVLGLLPVLGRVVAAVPLPVLGGAGIVLFGSVAASGIRTLARVEYEDNMNLVVVATSIAFGMIPIAKPDFYEHFPKWFATIFHSGISSAAVMAILLNILFNRIGAGNTAGQSVWEAGTTPRTLTPDILVPLMHGDHFVEGILYDVDGNEVPVAGQESAGRRSPNVSASPQGDGNVPTTGGKQPTPGH